MKKITVAVIGMMLLPGGAVAILTRPGKDNPSKNGVFKLGPGAAARLSQRTLGFASPIALKQAIALSNGGASLTMDVVTHKAGDAWENKITGQKGTYGEKNGGKDWVDYTNHELTVGAAASLEILKIAATAAIAEQATVVARNPVAAAQPQLGIPGDAPVASTEETAADAAGADAAEADVQP